MPQELRSLSTKRTPICVFPAQIGTRRAAATGPQIRTSVLWCSATMLSNLGGKAVDGGISLAWDVAPDRVSGLCTQVCSQPSPKTAGSQVTIPGPAAHFRGRESRGRGFALFSLPAWLTCLQMHFFCLQEVEQMRFLIETMHFFNGNGNALTVCSILKRFS